MSRIVLLASAALLAAPAAAQKNGAGLPTRGQPAPKGPVIAGRPLPANPPTATGQKLAFAGQAGAPAVVIRTPINVDIKTEYLNHPWGLAFIGDGKLIVTEKFGAMRVIEMASGRPIAAAEGVPRVVTGGDAGLLDIVADPVFAQNRMIYFTYIEPRGEEDSGIVVAKARLEPPKSGNMAPMYKLSGVTTLLRVEPGLPQKVHYGSRLLFDRNGALFVSLAERFFRPTRDDAQSLYSWFGKILRVDTNGKALPDNPFNRDQQAENHPQPEIWSFGHRNPQALTFNPVDGSLWDVEHGPDGGDEVNRIVKGANYGWPLVAYGTDYDHSPVDGRRTQMEGTEQPRYFWPAAIGPGGATFYSGDLSPSGRITCSSAPWSAITSLASSSKAIASSAKSGSFRISSNGFAMPPRARTGPCGSSPMRRTES